MLELRSISKRLGEFVLSEINLQLRSGEYFVLLGPSGVGKTVLLEIIAGLTQPDSGSVLWQGRDITRTPPEQRQFAVVYQDHALFPHMTVARNIAYGLRASGAGRRESLERVRSLAGMLSIRTLLERRVDGLSGGEKQRVALARALAADPQMLLLDEPLSALDRNIRVRLRKELKRIQRQTRKTFLHVTHDTAEAMSLADRIGVMLGQHIRQVAIPEDLFRAPSDRDVADFLGMRNVLSVTAASRSLCHTCGVEIHAAGADESTSYIWIKPEEILLSSAPFDSSARNQFRGTVREWEHSDSLLGVRVACGELDLTALITHASFRGLKIEVGKAVYATFKSSAVHCF